VIGAHVINSQDWYRVRRGEDQLAWGRRWRMRGLPGIAFAERARGEFAFLEPEQRAAVLEALEGLTARSDDAKGAPVAHGRGRRALLVDELCVIFRLRGRELWISTIRGGPVLDPEHKGPPPDDGTDWLPA
jgi:hypothetical protein